MRVVTAHGRLISAPYIESLSDMAHPDVLENNVIHRRAMFDFQTAVWLDGEDVDANSAVVELHFMASDVANRRVPLVTESDCACGR